MDLYVVRNFWCPILTDGRDELYNGWNQLLTNEGHFLFNWGNLAINVSAESKSQKRDTLSFLQVIKIVVRKSKVPSVVFVLGLSNTVSANGIEPT